MPFRPVDARDWLTRRSDALRQRPKKSATDLTCLVFRMNLLGDLPGQVPRADAQRTGDVAVKTCRRQRGTLLIRRGASA